MSIKKIIIIGAYEYITSHPNTVKGAIIRGGILK
jgi:hypothetical protein